VTHALYDGKLGGYAGADATCQSLAGAVSLGGTWKAWVADGTSSPSKRFTQATVAYRLLDGTLVAANYAALTSGNNLSHAIDLDETGVSHAGDTVNTSKTWTGANHNGNLDVASCTNFTSNAASSVGEVGECNNAGGGHWSQAVTNEPCNAMHHLYCFEQ
jgi:hypothetical protein